MLADLAGNAKVMMVTHAATVHISGEHMGDGEGLFFFLFLLILYFLPGLVAWWWRHRNETAIGVLNIFFGWTFIGCVAALLWACTDNTRPRGETAREA